MMKAPQSLTANICVANCKLPFRREDGSRTEKFLKIIGAHSHNVQGVDVMIPLGMLVAVTGVSGSGKSTLVYDVIYKAMQAKRTGGNWREFATGSKGSRRSGVEMVDQSPIGRTPRSNPATYLKAFDPIREVFAATPEAKKRGLTPGHFSFKFPAGAAKRARATER